MLIENVYQKLYNQSVCESAYDFSVRFLGKSKSYYSVLKARNEEASIEAIATLEVALNDTSQLFSDKHPILTKTRLSLQGLAKDVKLHREKRSKDMLKDQSYAI